MASLNPLTREVVFKIVFYGPGLGGKTTTLQHIHAASKPEHRGKMVSLATPMDRTLYFDFLPLRMPLLHGMHVRLQLFTVPGQVYFGATRRLVLTGADGVVFVADSQVGRQDANQEALEDLVMNLAENNLALMNLPHTFHWNKRDLPEILPIADLDRTLNRQGAPSIGTVATHGDGVFVGLERIARLVFQAYEAELPKPEAEPVERPVVERPAVEETTIADALRGLAEAPVRASSTAGPDSDGQRISPTSTHGAPPSAAPVSSLESIPNPIPRRPSSTTEVAGSPLAAALSATTTPRPPVPAPRTTPRSTPMPPIQPSVPAAPLVVAPTASPSPPPPEVVVDGVAAPPPHIQPSAPPPATRSPTRPPRDAVTSPPPSTREPTASHSLSFARLWADADRDAVRQTEAALADGDAPAALLACDVLLTRVLASAATLAGHAEAPRDMGVVVLLLGLDGRRYLAFRAAVRAARNLETVTLDDAFEMYLFALEARRRLAARDV
jgi:mutual gliding-motility protein MglA